MTSTLRRPSNGSVATANGGRSSSQISIYDYPEHLNPFHEDDNHKRIRFWKMSSGNKNAGRDRGNSFSLNGLKEMWAFKSFRLKKRSSTLGINKTSESPPQLRRQPAEQQPPLFDSRLRHTVSPNGTSGFDRGAGYRSSLQNVHSNGGSTSTLLANGSVSSSTIGFNRNDRYRSTIQSPDSASQTMPSRSYVHSRGSVTPTPQRSFMTHGLSQSSLNSTNPFDDEPEDVVGSVGVFHGHPATTTDNEDNVSRVTVNVVPDGVGGVRKVYRKKRRAPPPPPPRTSSVAGGADGQTASQPETAAGAITTVPETSRENSTEDDDITQLAAQIASFVRTADTDQEQLHHHQQHQTPEPEVKPQNGPLPIISTTSNTSTFRNTTITTSFQPPTTESTVVQRVQVEVHRPTETIAQCPPSPRPPRRALPANVRDSPENNAAYPERLSRTPTPTRETSPAGGVHNGLLPSDPEKQLNTLERVAPRIVVRSPTADSSAEEEVEQQPLPQVPQVPSTCVVRVVEQPRRQTLVHSLHISESMDDLPVATTVTTKSELSLQISESAEDVNEPQSPTTPLNDPERYKIKFVALKPSQSPKKPEPPANKPKWSAPWSSSSGKRSSVGAEEDATNVTTTKWSSPWSSSKRRSASPPVVQAVADSDEAAVTLRQANGNAGVADVAAPPRRRRSVKDIIESINKCQSLLRINQTDAAASLAVDKRVTSLEAIDHRGRPEATQPPSVIANGSASNESIVRNLTELQASEQQIRATISEMERQQSSDRNNNRTAQQLPVEEDANDVLHQLPVMVERFAEYEFKKCTGAATGVGGEGTASPVMVRRRDKPDGQQRTDWNPLPKPRRSRNLTQEAVVVEAAAQLPQ